MEFSLASPIEFITALKGSGVYIERTGMTGNDKGK